MRGTRRPMLLKLARLCPVFLDADRRTCPELHTQYPGSTRKRVRRGTHTRHLCSVASSEGMRRVRSCGGTPCAQAAFGRGALAVSGFCIYVSLALGLLGSALAFPFGIFVVICQRIPERPVQARALTMPGAGGERPHTVPM